MINKLIVPRFRFSHQFRIYMLLYETITSFRFRYQPLGGVQSYNKKQEERKQHRNKIKTHTQKRNDSPKRKVGARFCSISNSFAGNVQYSATSGRPANQPECLVVCWPNQLHLLEPPSIDQFLNGLLVFHRAVFHPSEGLWLVGNGF